jgi:hypothetical protein
VEELINACSNGSIDIIEMPQMIKAQVKLLVEQEYQTKSNNHSTIDKKTAMKMELLL